MPNIIPPLVSSSPPPILPGTDEDDEFGDFNVANDYSYDGLSLPTTPQHQPNNVETYENALSINNDTTNYTGLDTLEIKDNESQDSTTSIITPDSGLSSEMSNSIDDQTVVSDKKIELLENNLIEEKDYQDVRNDISDDTIYPSETLPPIQDSINLEVGDLFIEKSDLYHESDDIIKTDFIDEYKNFKDKRKIDVLHNTDECVEQDFADAKVDEAINSTEPINLNEIQTETITEHSKDVTDVNLEVETMVCEPDLNNSFNDDDDEFADFESASFVPTFTSNTKNEEENPVESPENEDSDFDDFADFSSAPSQLHPIPHDIHAEIIDLFSKKPNSSNKEILSKTIREIFTNSFSNIDSDNIDDVYPPGDILKSCGLWDRLEDIDNSKALNFRWEKSEIYSNYLKVINMDCRNILYGPNINAPRFASNIPLEPIKTTQVNSSAIENTIFEEPTDKTIGKNETTPNPELQFDWNSSGLENPLDLSQNNSMLLDIEELVSSLDNMSGGSCNVNESIGVASRLSEEIHNIDGWDYWTRSNSIKNRDIEPETSIPSTFEYSDTAPTDEDLNKPKDIDSVKSLQLSDLNIEAVLKPDLKQSNEFNSLENKDDDFSEFQACTAFEDKSSPVHVENKFSEMNLRETHISSVSDVNGNKNWSEKPSIDKIIKPELLVPNNPCHDISKSKIDDDEFSEFQYVPLRTTNGLNVPVSNIPIVEKNVPIGLNATPLQPIVIQNVAKAQESQPEINWPNPGISEDELNRLAELSFTINNKENVAINVDCEESLKEVELKSNLNSSEDDWSDFVSVSNSQDVNIVKSAMEPIVTISGQSQTVANAVLQSKSVLLSPKFSTEILKREEKPMQLTHSVSDYKVHASDDDWSDFVSNRDAKPVTVSNLKQGPRFTSWNQPPSFPNWNAPTSFTPNIITNPGHFEQGDGFNPFMAYVPNNNNSATSALPLCVTTTTSKNQTHTTLQAMKGRNASVSTISTLPDLDFLTPKTIQSRNTKK